jgi:CSLREA domain-containing protein
MAGLTLVGGDTSGDGGAILTMEPLVLSACHIVGNSAATGGGVAAINVSLVVNETEIRNNVTTSTSSSQSVVGGGGGVLVFRGSLALNHSTVTGNTAPVSGGGIFEQYSSLEITDSSVSENTAGRVGGGIDGTGGTLTVIRSRIMGNLLHETGGSKGAGIRFTGGQVDVVESIISGNRFASTGGGISASFTDLAVSRSQITNNTARARGGGIYTLGMPTAIMNSTIAGNSAPEGGGLTVQGEFTIDSSTISNNSLSPFSGSGVYVFPASHGTISNSTIASNGSVGLRVEGSAMVSLHHTIVAGQTQDISQSAISLFNALIGYVTYPQFPEAPLGSPDANGNLIGGPMHGLIDPKLGELKDNGGFTLPDGTHIKTLAILPGSPAINAGDLSLKAGENGVPQYDQRGEPYSRVFNGRIDIGAFEYQQPSDLNLVVDTLADESDGNYAKGDLSLREAIELANLYAGPNYPNVVDTIRFDPALTAAGPAIIKLTKGELAIKAATNFVGPGAMLLTIDASGNDLTPGVKDGKGSRIFTIIGPSANSRISVGISGLTLTGGDSTSGGAINSINADLVLAGSKVIANSSLFNGGALYVIAGNLTVRESLISGNAGGVTEGRGGGLYLGTSRSSIANQRLEIIDSEISNNSARNGGGGASVALTGGSILITGSKFSSNSLTGTSAFGGALQLTGSSSNSPTTVLVDNTTIDHNTNTGNGGGILIQGCEVTINNSTISNNTSNAMGGGIHITTSRPFVLTNSTISGNTAKTNGGGIWAQISLTSMLLSNNTIAGNSVTNTTGDNRGGGMYVSLRTMTSATIAGTAFRENTAGSGGGLYAVLLTNSAPLKVDHSTFVANKATTPASLGGGLFVGGTIGNVEIRDSAFEHNESQGIDGRGGGVYLMRPSTISGSKIVSNVSGRYGGGVFITNGATAQITTSEISNNSAINTKGFGGGIYNLASLTITDSKVNGNTATMNGGGIFTTSTGGPILRLERSRVEGNSAALDGGGVMVQSTFVVLVATTIAGNSSGRDGGGLWLLDIQSATIDSSTINNNTAARDGGGVLARGSATFNNSTLSQNYAKGDGGGIWAMGNQTIAHSTVYQNRADQAGGGVFVAANTATIRNSIIASNTGPLGRDLSGLLGAMLDVRYSLIGSNQGSGLTPSPTNAPDANGNFIGGTTTMFSPSLEPLASNGGPTMTHAPMPGSRVINAGDPAAVPGAVGVPQFDQRGQPFARVVGGRIDMGAVESQGTVLPGDYNYDGVVDAADYVIYRNSLASENLQADGNQDGRVTDGDWTVWKSNYGAGRPAAIGIMPLQAVSTSGYVAYHEAVDTVMTEAYRPLPRIADTLATTTTNHSAISGTRAAVALRRPQSNLREADSLLTTTVAGIGRRVASAVDDGSSGAFGDSSDGACDHRATVHGAVFDNLTELTGTLR